jgi:hypothetical protein
MALSTLASLVLLAGVLTAVLSGGSGLTGPVHTPWSAARALPESGTHVKAPAGSFLLADFITSEGWQQNTTGPEPGNLTCPTSLTCYVTGDNATSSSGSPTYNSFYVSNDGALSWSVLPVPAGVDFTTALACANAEGCAAGATDKGQPVFITTSDGGHSFTIDPLPSGDGTLYSLACPSTSFCAGLAATSVDPNNNPINATFLSTTTDGANFIDSPLPTGQSMTILACPTTNDCVAVGTSDALGIKDWTSGVVATTSDGGTTWTSGAFPAGFGIDYLSGLACADAEHCSVVGNIAVTVKNPPQCSTISPRPPSSTTPSQSTPQSPAVQAIARMESLWASESNAKEATEGSVECGPGSSFETFVSDIATTSDGGLTWTPEALPSTAPSPQLNDITCASDTYCVVTGSAAIFQQFGNDGSNGGSAIVLVTNDGGANWRSVTFAVPSSVPSGVQIDAFMAVGQIQCPQVNDCVALGVSDQGSKTTPVYTSTPSSTAPSAS